MAVENGTLYGFYRALVINQNDPDLEGRVKVRIPDIMLDKVWCGDYCEHGIWARPANLPLGGRNTPDTMGQRCSYTNAIYQGSCMIPQEGSHVFVFFEKGDPNRPFYFASADYGQTKVLPENQCGTGSLKWTPIKTHEGRTFVISDDGYDARVELTGKKRQIYNEPDGDKESVYNIDGNQTVFLIDERGGHEKVFIKDYRGNYIKLIQDEEGINDQLHVFCKDDMHIESGKNIYITAAENIHVLAKKSIYITAMENMFINVTAHFSEMANLIDRYSKTNDNTFAGANINTKSVASTNRHAGAQINDLSVDSYKNCSGTSFSISTQGTGSIKSAGALSEASSMVMLDAPMLTINQGHGCTPASSSAETAAATPAATPANPDPSRHFDPPTDNIVLPNPYRPKPQRCHPLWWFDFKISPVSQCVNAAVGQPGSGRADTTKSDSSTAKDGSCGGGGCSGGGVSPTSQTAITKAQKQMEDAQGLVSGTNVAASNTKQSVMDMIRSALNRAGTVMANPLNTIRNAFSNALSRVGPYILNAVATGRALNGPGVLSDEVRNLVAMSQASFSRSMDTAFDSINASSSIRNLANNLINTVTSSLLTGNDVRMSIAPTIGAYVGSVLSELTQTPQSVAVDFYNNYVGGVFNSPSMPSVYNAVVSGIDQSIYSITTDLIGTFPRDGSFESFGAQMMQSYYNVVNSISDSVMMDSTLVPENIGSFVTIGVSSVSAPCTPISDAINVTLINRMSDLQHSVCDVTSGFIPQTGVSETFMESASIADFVRDIVLDLVEIHDAGGDIESSYQTLVSDASNDFSTGVLESDGNAVSIAKSSQAIVGCGNDLISDIMDVRNVSDAVFASVQNQLTGYDPISAYNKTVPDVVGDLEGIVVDTLTDSVYDEVYRACVPKLREIFEIYKASEMSEWSEETYVRVNGICDEIHDICSDAIATPDSFSSVVERSTFSTDCSSAILDRVSETFPTKENQEELVGNVVEEAASLVTEKQRQIVKDTIAIGEGSVDGEFMPDVNLKDVYTVPMTKITDPSDDDYTGLDGACGCGYEYSLFLKDKYFNTIVPMLKHDGIRCITLSLNPNFENNKDTVLNDKAIEDDLIAWQRYYFKNAEKPTTELYFNRLEQMMDSVEGNFTVILTLMDFECLNYVWLEDVPEEDRYTTKMWSENTFGRYVKEIVKHVYYKKDDNGEYTVPRNCSIILNLGYRSYNNLADPDNEKYTIYPNCGFIRALVMFLAYECHITSNFMAITANEDNNLYYYNPYSEFRSYDDYKSRTIGEYDIVIRDKVDDLTNGNASVVVYDEKGAVVGGYYKYFTDSGDKSYPMTYMYDLTEWYNRNYDSEHTVLEHYTVDGEVDANIMTAIFNVNSRKALRYALNTNYFDFKEITFDKDTGEVVC